MMVYRISGDALLRLAVMAARVPDANIDMILAIIRSTDVEPEPDAPGDVAVGDVPVDDAAIKPAKPE